MATAVAAAELKQQGAIEAAQDPDSKVTADDAQQKIVEESRRAGVTAFTFNPDASPEEKKAQAQAVRVILGNECIPPKLTTKLYNRLYQKVSTETQVVSPLHRILILTASLSSTFPHRPRLAHSRWSRPKMARSLSVVMLRRTKTTGGRRPVGNPGLGGRLSRVSRVRACSTIRHY